MYIFIAIYNIHQITVLAIFPFYPIHAHTLILSYILLHIHDVMSLGAKVGGRLGFGDGSEQSMPRERVQKRDGNEAA